MLRNKLRYAVAFLALALLPGSALSAKDKKAKDEPEQPLLVEIWLHRLDTAEQNLRESQFFRARTTANELIRQMLDSIQGGPGTSALLARTLVVRSFAEAGLGNMREAVWDWLAARAVHPELTDESLTRAGAVGDKLLEAMAPPKKADAGETTASATADAATSQPEIHPMRIGGGVTRPEKISGRVPQYPYALRSCVVGAVILESIVDEQGEARRPGVLASPNPLLSLASLEALRGWRFRPARYQGKPVEVYYTLTVNFSTDDCRQARKSAQKE